MAVEKLSISVDTELAVAVRAAAEERGMSVSSWLSEAAEAQVRRRRLWAALDHVAAADGALDDDEATRLIADARARSSVVLGAAKSGAA
ncbi:MAG: hypothetical protein M3Z25_16135 [Actinomycetota bacterium]|nr:hypothetical protein [Actinomycetota bacterium]